MYRLNDSSRLARTTLAFLLATRLGHAQTAPAVSDPNPTAGTPVTPLSPPPPDVPAPSAAPAPAEQPAVLEPPAPSPAAAPTSNEQAPSQPASAPPPSTPPTASPSTNATAAQVTAAQVTAAQVTAAQVTTAQRPPAWSDRLSLGGGVILYYYQPTQGSGKNNLSVFFANLLLDAKWDDFALHLEPRFRDTKLRSFFDGPAWLQEAYASGRAGPVTVKVGKEYQLLGLFWDNSFYGNVQVYDGLKLDPNYGISVEGHTGGSFGVDFAAQYFLVDGGTNVSLANRDTLSVPGARRRNSFIGRLAPTFEFSGGKAHVGLSAEHLEADLPDGKKGVGRFAADAKLTYQSFGIWGEGLLQKGRHVTDFPYVGDPTAEPPVPGLASAHNRYFLLGAEYGIGPVTLRYNISYASYHDVRVSETMHVPALGFTINEHLSVLAEYVNWKRHALEGNSTVDDSLNVTLNGSL